MIMRDYRKRWLSANYEYREIFEFSDGNIIFFRIREAFGVVCKEKWAVF
ncbi:hypothetical protein HMPREF1870_01932 [Bacteroidales bacterium KA00344]|nr:hypothetical protein HMPREF1870_01932 [Bacteroidales bacterium KA00344]